MKIIILFCFYLHGIRHSAGRDQRDPRRNAFRFPVARSDQELEFCKIGAEAWQKRPATKSPSSRTSTRPRRAWPCISNTGWRRALRCRCVPDRRHLARYSGQAQASISNPPTVSKKPHFPALVQNDTLDGNWSLCPGSSTLACSITGQRGSVGEAWRATAENLAGTGRKRRKNPGRRARRRQRQNVGIRLAGRAGRGLDLQCPGMGGEP